MNDYILSGNATFTIVDNNTGQRYTYKVKKHDTVWFVRVLCGPDNEGDFRYLGTIHERDMLFDVSYDYWHGRKSRISESAPSAVFFREWWDNPSAFTFYKSNRCCRCGRTLTDPVSIEMGIGPICRHIRD